MYRLAEYTSPLQSLMEQPWYKAIFAALATLASELFVTEGKLVAVVFTMVFLDAITGIMAAHRRNDVITSLGMRRTVVKLLEYMCVVIAAVALGNSFNSWLFWLPEFTAAYVGVTEFKSVIENVGMVDYWEKIKDRIWPAGSSEPPKNDDV